MKYRQMQAIFVQIIFAIHLASTQVQMVISNCNSSLLKVFFGMNSKINLPQISSVKECP